MTTVESPRYIRIIRRLGREPRGTTLRNPNLSCLTTRRVLVVQLSRVSSSLYFRIYLDSVWQTWSFVVIGQGFPGIRVHVFQSVQFLLIQ